jgi:hypothetical protein
MDHRACEMGLEVHVDVESILKCKQSNMSQYLYKKDNFI